jgi:hypothetical protein
MALSRNFLYYSTLVMITVMTYGFSTTLTRLRLYCSRIYCVFFCHVSKQAIRYQRWILFVFSIFLTAYHHGTATEMEGMNESKGYGTLQRKQHAQSTATLTSHQCWQHICKLDILI